MGINRATPITKVVQDDYDNGNQTIVVTRADGSRQTEIWQWDLNTEDFYNHDELSRGNGFKSDADRYADIKKHAKQFKFHRNYTKEIERLERRHGKPIREILDSLADAAKDVNKNPSEGQKESGNYKKGHTSVHGLAVCIENPKGSIRSGKNKQGKTWQSTMNAHYGYFKKTEGADGDEIDVFFGSSAEDESPGIFVVNQNDDKGVFDEHKVMFGYADIESAKKSYLGNYNKGWTGLGSIKAVSLNDFKQWLKSGRTKAIMDALGEDKMTTPILDSRDELWAARLKRLIKDGMATLKATDSGIEARIKARGDVVAAYDELSSEEVEQPSTASWESSRHVQDVIEMMKLKNKNDNSMSFSHGGKFIPTNRDQTGLSANYGTQSAVRDKVEILGEDITPSDIDALVSFLEQKTEDYDGLSPLPADSARTYARSLLDKKARIEGVDDLPITEKDIEFYQSSAGDTRAFVESGDYPFTSYEAARIYADRVSDLIHSRKKSEYEASDIYATGLKLADMLSSNGFVKAATPGLGDAVYARKNAGTGNIAVYVNDSGSQYGAEKKEGFVDIGVSYSGDEFQRENEHLEHNVKTGNLTDVKKKILAFADQFKTVVDVTNAPAYGSKYDSELRDGKDIAKELRKTFKDAAKSGDTPKEVKLSIRSSYNSIDIDIKALPDSIPVFSKEFIQWDVEKEDRWGSLPREIKRHSPEMQALTRFIKDHANAYNYDRSDTMTDYFDTNFYLSVGVDHDLEKQVRKDAVSEFLTGKESEGETEETDKPVKSEEPSPIDKRFKSYRGIKPEKDGEGLYTYYYGNDEADNIRSVTFDRTESSIKENTVRAHYTNYEATEFRNGSKVLSFTTSIMDEVVKPMLDELIAATPQSGLAEGLRGESQDTQEPAAQSKTKPYWTVNYVGENDPESRAESIKLFDKLKDAKSFSEGKSGYTVRMEEGGENLFVEYLGGFSPSSTDAAKMRSIGVWDTPQELTQREITANRSARAEFGEDKKSEIETHVGYAYFEGIRSANEAWRKFKSNVENEWVKNDFNITMTEFKEAFDKRLKSELGDDQPQEPDMQSQIEALRTMPIAEYEAAIDPLIEELEAAGRYAEFEALLTEIDESRDAELESMGG